MSELVLSSTSVSTYLECHLAWFFRYVLQLEGLGQSKELDLGIATHEHVQEILDPGAGGGFSVDPEVLRLVDVWKAHVQPELGEVSHVEEPYAFEVNGVSYQSIIDYVDGRIVADLKTTKNRPRKGRYWVSLMGHALGYRSLTGEKEEGRRLDYLVKTKEAYYWPESFDTATVDDIAQFGATIEQVAEGIDREDFAATGLDSPWACAMCPYRDECGPRQRYEEGRS